MKPRTQSKSKTGKQEQVDGENEPCSSTESDGNTLLRRSSRIQTIIKNATAVASSKPSVLKKATKRIADCEIGCEPNKKLARESSQLKKITSKNDLVKRRSSSKKCRKKTDEVEDSAMQHNPEDTECHFDRLPTEVLTEIFTYLTFRDRKSARLVCRRWLDANNSMQFSYDEKLLCYALYDFNVVIRTLETSTRKILNLEFYDIKFDDRPRALDFWRNSGWKIESLLFSDCVLSDETIQHIVLHCNNLKCLSLENMSNRGNQKMCSDDCINMLINSGIVRDSLYFFEMNINETGWISNNFLRAFFLIYPNIKQFSFYCDTVEDDFNVRRGNVDLESTSKCTFTSIMNKLTESQSELDSITLDIGDYRTLDYLPAAEISKSIASLEFPELREIKFDLELIGSQQNHPIIDFFPRHKQLTSVECQIFVDSSATDFMTQLMNCLLDSCPYLQCLQILLDTTFSNPTTLNSNIFSKIRKSRLDSLTFNFGFEIASADAEAVNDCLRTLCIVTPGVEKDAFLSICKIFRGLLHLEVSNIDDESLQTILQYQRSLKSLKLIDCQNCTDYGFTGCRSDEENNDQPEGFSIQILNELQYLELKMSGTTPQITEKTLAQFKFPNLLYLHVTIDTLWELCSDLVKMFSNLPKIEGLACYFDEVIDYSVWQDLCIHLKKLRYLHIQFKEFKNFGDRKYKRLFEFCPTLRALIHRSNCSGPRSQSYYYDVVKKKVAKKKSDREYRISSEQIDTFSVNWMWF